MTAFYIDTFLHVYNTVIDINVGYSSKYSYLKHPGTNQKIKGLRWDKSFWPTELQIEYASYVPALWDATYSGINNTYWQSGYGDNDDLLLVEIQDGFVNGLRTWTPVLNHGYFYSHFSEWYLFSDSYQTEYFSSTQLSGGHQYVDLEYSPKESIPILVRKYSLDNSTGQFTIKQEFRKVVEFLDEGAEFYLDSSYSPPRIELNGNYAVQIGTPLILVSGVPTVPGNVSTLEKVGVSTGEPDQIFFLGNNPVDPDADVHIYSYSDSNMITEWTVIDGLDSFTDDSTQVKLDRDLGKLTFGDRIGTTGDGAVPRIGHRICASYTEGIAVHYEPTKTTNMVTVHDINLNPLYAATHQGFLQVAPSVDNTVNVVLDATNLTGTITDGYELELGNNFANLLATVYDPYGAVLENQEITFEIYGFQIGSLSTVSALTNSIGQARSVYAGPTSITSLGKAVIDVAHTTFGTTVHVTDIPEPSSLTKTYLYQILSSDNLLGIPSDEVDDYYDTYIEEEELDSTSEEEINYRESWELALPTSTDELDVGRYKMVFASGINTIDPYTGIQRAAEPYPYTPINPSSIVSNGTITYPDFTLVFDNYFLTLPGSDSVKAYFVIAETQVYLRASTINKRTGAIVYSNILNLDIVLPDSINGTYYADLLASVPGELLRIPRDVTALTDEQILTTSGLNGDDYWEEKLAGESYVTWYKRTRRGDTEGLEESGLGLVTVTVSGIVPNEIPLGFRIRDTDITVAAVLDQVVYVQPNDPLTEASYWPADFEEV